jgi:hypothetical protein
MFGLIKFITMLFRSGLQLLDPDKNPLRHAPVKAKWLASVLLGSFWALAFTLYIGEIWLVGYNIIGHILLITMVFVTWLTFRHFKNTYSPRSGPDYLRMPDRSSRCDELTDEQRLLAVQKADQLLGQ